MVAFCRGIENSVGTGNPNPPTDGGEAPAAGRNGEVGWHGLKRSNDTHQSMTDPEARLYRKSNNTAKETDEGGIWQAAGGGQTEALPTKAGRFGVRR